MKKPNGYWTEERICKELKILISKINYFPTNKQLESIGESKLSSAIRELGGISNYRKLLGYSPYDRTRYWKEERILNRLIEITKKTNAFPTQTYLKTIGEYGLLHAISNKGGLIKYRNILGYSSLIYDEYMKYRLSYCSNRGKKTEDLIYSILVKYCKEKELVILRKNNILSKGNIIEFVCDIGKKIGIDVTNTRTESAIQRKWTKKDYYKYLDELWIVVVSDSFTEEDYIKWNKGSPYNVYIYSIEDFCNELQYDLDEYTKNKIERYKSCTFHTRNNLKEQHLNISKVV